MAYHTHTQTHAHRDTHRQIQIPFLHFTLFGSFGIHAKDTDYIFGIQQTSTCIDIQTCTHIDKHTCTDILTHRYKYTQTHACLYTYTNKHTHTNMQVGNLRKLLVQIHF